MTKKIVIGICTYKRPKMLKTCLESIKNLILPNDYNVSLVIVDNCPNQTAELIIQQYKKDFPLNINNVSELNKGYASARNRVLKEALNLNPDYIAFIDDDEFIDSHESIIYPSRSSKFVFIWP